MASLVSMRDHGERRTYLEEILILQMGGTIDKCYPRTRSGYAFEIDSAASKRVLARLRPGRSTLVFHDTVCRKDSLEVTDNDRNKLLARVMGASQRRILVTHGTDTLLQTAQWLQEQLQNCVGPNSRLLVFTGAFTPEVFKDSDADFNIGMALGAVQSLAVAGNSRAYVAMNGLVCPCESMERDPETGQFLPCRRPRSRDMALTRPRSGEMTRPRSGEHLRQRSLESLLDSQNSKTVKRRSTGSSRESLLERISDTETEPEPEPELERDREREPTPRPEPDLCLPSRQESRLPSRQESRLPKRSTPPDPIRRQVSAPAPLTLVRPSPSTAPSRRPPRGPPPAVADAEADADAVFTASMQYLMSQRAKSCPQMSRTTIPPRSNNPPARREPETTSDPSLAAARRPSVRTNGSLLATSSGSTASSSFGLRRSAALVSLESCENLSQRDESIPEDDDVVNDDVSESPLAAQKKTPIRRTLPPGWRHLPQRALEDLLEEEEAEPRQPRSLLRRLSEGGRVTENISEEYL